MSPRDRWARAWVLPPGVTERELLEGCRAGEPRAAAELVRLHQETLVRVLRRLVRRPAIVEELMQETFFRLFRSIDRIDAARGAKGWLLRTAINLARNHASRDVAPEDPLPDHAAETWTAAGNDPETDAIARDRRRRILAALDALPLRYREVLVLQHVEDLSFSEMARVLRTPVPALKMRALRARARLFEILEREGT